MMYKKFFLFLLGFVCAVALQAQCEGCTQAEGFEADHCFTHSSMPGYCAQFKLDESFFYLQKKEGKEGMKLSLPDSMDMGTLHTFMSDKANKIKKSADALFVLKALESWNMKSETLLAEQAAKMAKAAAEKAASELFTEANLNEVQYEQKYPSGLKMHIIEQGGGTMPKAGQTVSVHYRGYLLTGKVFDESYKRGNPIVFPVGTGRVIRGWDESIMKLNVGSRALIYLPAEIAYGDRGAGADIPPGATLVFDVVLMEVK